MNTFSLEEIRRITVEAECKAQEELKKEGKEALQLIKTKIFNAATRADSFLSFTRREVTYSHEAILYALEELKKMGFSTNWGSIFGSSSFQTEYEYQISW